MSAVVREGKIDALTSIMQSSRKLGMQEMDDALEELVEDDVIDGVDAYMKAIQKRRFAKYMEEE